MNRESAASQRERGVRARKAIKRKELGVYTPVDRDPAEVIKMRDAGRIPELVPLRHARMAESEFAFFRGSAGLMAFDLAHQAQTDTHLVICGDAHLNNFGLYASPERRLVFDLNDFDEAAPGPWEWDVKRLLTSAILAAKEIDATRDQIEEIVLAGARAYCESLQQLLEMSALDRHYVSIDEDAIANRVRDEALKEFGRVTTKARKRDADRTVAHLMEADRMGFVRFKEDPPIVTRVESGTAEDLESLFSRYRQTTMPDIGFLLSRYEITDFVRRVVGVGSVGTRCYLVALSGPEGTGFVLQIKEAVRSVIDRFAVPNATTPLADRGEIEQGERVVDCQRILQAVSDPFLGYVSVGGRDYYVRQYRDAKGSFDTRRMDTPLLEDYVALCASMLARAHAQSPLAHWVGAYIGDGDAFAKAMLAWCQAYSEQVTRDYERYLQAIKAGEVDVEVPESVGEDEDDFLPVGLRP